MDKVKKIKRKLNVRSIRMLIALSAATVCVVTVLYACWSYFYPSTFTRQQSNTTVKHSIFLNRKNIRVFQRPMRHVPLNEIYRDGTRKPRDQSMELEEEKFPYMVDTPGCQIPAFIVQYKKYTKPEKSCGNRAVFLKRFDDYKVQVMIKHKMIRKLLKKNSKYNCCYMYWTSKGFTSETQIEYTDCKIIKDGDKINLENDFINVKCFEYENTNITRVIYDDRYAFCKKLYKVNTSKCQDKYNVLMVGMDSMSLPRFIQSMTRTVTFFKDNYWFGYRGYHKIGDNTFPNLMATFTGLDLKTIAKKCFKRMDTCNDLFIWSQFKKAGYVTAYGEDYLRLPDTFSRDYAFHKPPTHHYMKTFYLKGETEINNRSSVCAGKKSSGKQLLDYAYDFALTYRKQNFFGFFWMNSYSHNINNHPEQADHIFENFLNRLSYIGILENTFVIILSDHGIRFGDKLLNFESYYDNRMPSLFIWQPTIFKWKYPKKLKSLATNQFRLITPRDLYKTLLELSRMAQCEKTSATLDDNYNSQSLFRVVTGNRTCRDIGIEDKWCSCHKLYPLSHNDLEGIKGVYFVVKHIKDVVDKIQTKNCTKCATLTLKNITRIHFYYDKEKINLYYVVAFSMIPENVYYEATILKKDMVFSLVGPISIISSYRGFGKCTVNPKDKVFCVCQKIDNCQTNDKRV